MAAEFLREHQFIVDVMSACTHDVSMEVRFEYLRPLLIDIFPRMTLSRDEGYGRASCDIMINICDSAKRLSKEDFIKFVDAIHKDHPTSAQLIRRKYKEISGKDLPSFSSQQVVVPVAEEETPIPCQADVQARSHPRAQASNISVHNANIPAPVKNPQVQGTDRAVPVSFTPKPQQLPLIDMNADDVYLMETRPRGIALIINNMDFEYFSKRKGSDVDVSLFKKMFDKLKFETLVEENKKAKEMDQIFRHFAKDHRLKNVSAISIVILTHGSENDCYYGVDGRIIREHGKNKPLNCITKVDLAKIFSSRNCNYMKGKPKLFIIQACRGEDENESDIQNSQQQVNYVHDDAPKSEYREEVSALEADDGGTERPRADTADMCFVHSSSMGYKAYRNVLSGSPFIKELTTCISNADHNAEFLDIVRKMQKIFSEKKLENSMMTLPDFSTQLVKRWYITPSPNY